MTRRVPLPLECQARVACPIDQPARAVHGHHRKRRSQGGPNDDLNIIGVCSPGCHEHIHANPAESYQRGLLIHSWDEVSQYVPWWTL